jgi:hypothetical protein
MTYQWGKPQPRACRGECGGDKTPLQISRRKDQAGRPGIEEKASKPRTSLARQRWIKSVEIVMRLLKRDRHSPIW